MDKKVNVKSKVVFSDSTHACHNQEIFTSIAIFRCVQEWHHILYDPKWPMSNPLEIVVASFKFLCIYQSHFLLILYLVIGCVIFIFKTRHEDLQILQLMFNNYWEQYRIDISQYSGQKCLHLIHKQTEGRILGVLEVLPDHPFYIYE